MRENGPESAPEGHGRAPRTDLLSYLRVSTDKQGVSGLDPEAQREAFDRNIRGLGGKLLSEHIEVESGKNNDLNDYSPVIWLAEIRFGSAFGKPCSVGEPPRTPRGSAGQGRPQLPSHYRHRRGWPA